MPRTAATILTVVLALALSYALWKPLLANPPFALPAGTATPSPTPPPYLDRRFPEITLTGQDFWDVIDFFRDVTGENIYVDWPALHDAGVTEHTPIHAHLKDVRVSRAWNTVLTDASPQADQAIAVVTNGVRFITTRSQAAAGMVCQVHDVRGLQIDRDSLRRFIGPGTWRSDGGRGDIQPRPGYLVVVNTPQVQDELARHLAWRRWLPGAAAFAWRSAALLAGALLTANLLRALHRRRQPRPGHCPACGYDLRATPDRCPECGTPSAARPG